MARVRFAMAGGSPGGFHEDGDEDQVSQENVSEAFAEAAEDFRM